MSNQILLCLNQNDIKQPYKFQFTNINVYSFEEALYHCYHYWKQSTDDFLSDSFIYWVKKDLNLRYLADKISEIKNFDKLSVQFLKFLSLVDYFDDEKLKYIADEIAGWEKRLVWERLKEQADSLVEIDEFEKAITIYNKALYYDSNPQIYNNLGLAYSKNGDFTKAYKCFERAYYRDSFNQDIIFNFAETSIFVGNYESAKSLINTVISLEDKYYLFGQLNFEMNNNKESVEYFYKAYNIASDDFYLYKIIDICIKEKDYISAVNYLDRIEDKSSEYKIKYSEVYFKQNKIKDAIRILEEAVLIENDNIELLINLAKYYRLNENLEKAHEIISKALEIDSQNVNAQFESAIIKKSQGKIKDFQGILNSILGFFKKRYRESNEL